MDLNFVSVHKHTKKELGQYPGILTSHLVNNPYIFVTDLFGDTAAILNSIVQIAIIYLSPKHLRIQNGRRIAEKVHCHCDLLLHKESINYIISRTFDSYDFIYYSLIVCFG